MPPPTTTARPSYDPELAQVLSALPLPETITVEMIQPLRDTPFTAPIEQLLVTRAIDHSVRTFTGPGSELTISVFTPRGESRPGAGIFYLYGGGMITGDRFTGVEHLLDWVEKYQAIGLSLEYRRAPENPDPAPWEDGYAGLLWTFQNAAELGIDPAQILLAGTSAGADIAAGVALPSRDRGGPRVLAQLLMSPMLDDRDDTVSTHQYSRTGSSSRESNVTGWTALLGEKRSTADVSVYAAPARATDLVDLPPAFIDVGSAEVFRDEAVEYASKLWAAGVRAELHVWAGGFHIFEGPAPTAAVSIAALAARDRWLSRTLRTAHNSSDKTTTRTPS